MAHTPNLSESTESAQPTRHEPFLKVDLTGLRCPDCGYSLAGLTQMECPECGEPFDPIDVAARQQSNFLLDNWKLLLFIAAYIGAVIVGFVYLYGGPYTLLFQSLVAASTTALVLWARRRFTI